MPDEPNLQVHFRLDSPELRRRLDAYCATERRSIAAAMNLFTDKALIDWETQRATEPKGDA